MTVEKLEELNKLIASVDDMSLEQLTAALEKATVLTRLLDEELQGLNNASEIIKNYELLLKDLGIGEQMEEQLTQIVKH